MDAREDGKHSRRDSEAVGGRKNELLATHMADGTLTVRQLMNSLRLVVEFAPFLPAFNWFEIMSKNQMICALPFFFISVTILPHW